MFQQATPSATCYLAATRKQRRAHLEELGGDRDRGGSVDGGVEVIKRLGIRLGGKERIDIGLGVVRVDPDRCAT